MDNTIKVLLILSLMLLPLYATFPYWDIYKMHNEIYKPNLAIVSSTILRIVACEDSGCLKARNSSMVSWSGLSRAASDHAALSLMMVSMNK